MGKDGKCRLPFAKNFLIVAALDWIPHLYLSNFDDPSVLSEETHGAGETDRLGFAIPDMTAQLITQLCIK